MDYGKYKDVWKKLLSSRRFEEDGLLDVKLVDSKVEEYRTPYEADMGRAIFSQPFRRLAGKTQVHPFATVDYIHNRLTHSIEVGYVSRALGRRIARFILKTRGDFTSYDSIDEVGWVCQSAGLMHDIGNPPYGHAGEDAIRAWAIKNENQLQEIFKEDNQAVVNDFKYFDGNAQAFRMASRPGLRESCYFRLTCSTLGSMVKYPYLTSSKEGKKGKSAAFVTEEKLYEDLKKELGLDNGQRHPLSYVMEAADDICYRINDFEDAVLMGLMDEIEVRDMLLDGMDFEKRRGLIENKASLSRVRALAIGELIETFAKVFEDYYDQIMSFSLDEDLKSRIGKGWGGVLCRIKEKYNHIFSERKKVVSEIGAFGQIANILDKYLAFLKEIHEKKKNKEQIGFGELSFLSQRLITLAWGGHEYFDKNSNRELSWWAHAVLDYVVGMTDEYLHKVANEFM